jgi:hypothetical protein
MKYRSVPIAAIQDAFQSPLKVKMTVRDFFQSLYIGDAELLLENKGR